MSSDFCSYLFWISPWMYNCLIIFTNKSSPPFWKCGVVGIRIRPYHLWRMPDENVSLQDAVLDSFVWVIRHCDSPCPAKGVSSTLSLCYQWEISLCFHLQYRAWSRPSLQCMATWKWITSGAASLVTSSLVCLFLGDAIAISLLVLLHRHRMRQRHKPHARMLFLIVWK